MILATALFLMMQQDDLRQGLAALNRNDPLHLGQDIATPPQRPFVDQCADMRCHR